MKQIYSNGEDLKHLPGHYGIPFLGNTLPLLKDTIAFGQKMHGLYGNVYRSHSFGKYIVTMMGAEANELVLFDRDKNFSSKWGWEANLGKLFPRGLMLRDFEDHRLHRKAMSGAFKTAPMKNYLIALDRGITKRVSEWHEKPNMLFYPAIKQLTLDLASTSFLGEGLENQSDEIQTAFVNMVAAAVGVVRVPLPFTKLRKGLMGREKIIEIFSKEVPRRRESTGEDIFTELCKATYDDGSLMSIEDVVDHMSFLLMAAHDTLTSSLSSLIYHLAINPDWQDKLREEAKTLNLGESFFYEKLDEMPLTEMAFKEAMRIYPPVPVIPRLSIKAFEFGGFKIPANTVVIISPLGTQNMDELWEQPSKFDPMRFTQENSRNRHKYAWVPFSGGAHMCLGLHFAYMQAKCFVARLLLTSRITVPEGYKTNWQILPIPKPKDRLPIKIEKIAN